MGSIGTGLMAVFVKGLAQSISASFAGFWGALPFVLIVLFGVSLAVYDFGEDTVKENRR